MPKVKGNITIELLKVFQNLSDQLNQSGYISKVLHGITDIKASGNEIEASLRNILSDLLPTKYAIGHGHIVDEKLNVSKQYDLVITDGLNSRSVLKTKDGTELFLFETVYSIGEVKATWDLQNLLSTIESIKDLKNRLIRKKVAKTTIFSGNSEIHLNSPITKYPFRNPLFSFGFALKSDDKLNKCIESFKQRENWRNLPNLTVILNEGVFILVNTKKLKENELSISLYPEFVSEDNDYDWRFISSSTAQKNLAYFVFCLIEHMTNCVLEEPSYLNYSTSLLQIEDDELLNLDEL